MPMQPVEDHGAEIHAAAHGERHAAACGQALREAAAHGEEPMLKHAYPEGLQPMGNEPCWSMGNFENNGGVDGKSYRQRTTPISLPLCVALVGGDRKVRNEGVKLNLGIRRGGNR